MLDQYWCTSKFKLIEIILIIFILFPVSGFSQEEDQEIEETENILDLSNLPYFLNDVMIIGGVNSSGIYWSNHFRDLTMAGGFNLGLEGFIPLGQVSFIDYGVHFAQRNFRHSQQNILIKNNHLDFPLYVSFMLPELRTIDWRFFLGTQFSYRLSSNLSENYSPFIMNDFQYDPQRFNRFDTGMTFGLSGEVGNFFFRARSYVGVSKLDRAEQGAMFSMMLEGGYFLFRNYRR
ncbi:outer membrane protein with beta-barrel domain [Mongoliibacter ruber]|uniref:Outer membrane protein with beta-barrel domain n=1 Tax=Mongoliibacter ruber TaxID=1750599 RepID=A0A2T0WG67_9BACT|nr:outer membrane protein with beta-barrel domain [Mongoliibacter ruber]